MTVNTGVQSYNVSKLKTFLECEQKGHYKYHDGRSPNRREQALDIGTLWHKLMDARLQGATNPQCVQIIEDSFQKLFQESDPQYFHKVSHGWKAIEPAFWAWKPNPEWEVIGTEMVVHRQLPGVRIEGTLDALVKWNGQFWHLQHKTLGASTPPDVYMAFMQRDWHECIYQWIAGDTFKPYGGTILNVVRKLSFTTISANPSHALWSVPIPRDNDQVMKAVSDMATAISRFEMLKVTNDPIQNRSACAGWMGNRLCPYIGVCNGVATLTDDTLFKPTEDRYNG